jgi:hypothetical protein
MDNTSVILATLELEPRFQPPGFLVEFYDIRR